MSQLMGTIEKVLRNFPAALVLGGVILFLAAANHGIPQLSLQIQELGWRFAVAVLGVSLTLCGIVIGVRARRDAKPLADRSSFELALPEPIRRQYALSFLARKDKLVVSQRVLLDYLEAESKRRGAVRQEEMEDRFGDKYPGVYWRLETLIFLGFIEKEVANHRDAIPVYIYRLSPGYGDQLGGNSRQT
jgi:hypothetical protein